MIYKHFHDYVKKTKKDFGAALPDSDWPEEWKKIYFKSYPRFPKMKLLNPPPVLDCLLTQALTHRKSSRDFDSRKTLGLKEISQLLIYGTGIKEVINGQKINDWDSTHRTYASGGARYPIELYPVILAPTGDFECGAYHFNFKECSLEFLAGFENDELRKLMREKILTYSWAADASLVILMSAVFWRSAVKYEDFSYRLFWAECGHIGQNFYLLSQALGLKCCALAGVNEDEANNLLGLDGENESVLMAYVIGK